jgi:hypothetical protein
MNFATRFRLPRAICSLSGIAGVLATLGILLSTVTRAAAELPFLKGVTVSCQTWGGEWQTPEMAQTLDELKSLGANSFAIIRTRASRMTDT